MGVYRKKKILKISYIAKKKIASVVKSILKVPKSMQYFVIF